MIDSKVVYCWICHQDEENKDSIGYYICKCTIKREAHLNCLKTWHIEHKNDKCSHCKIKIKKLKAKQPNTKSIKVPQQTYTEEQKGDRELFFDSYSSSNNSSNTPEHKQEESTILNHIEEDFFESQNKIVDNQPKDWEEYWEYCKKK